MAMVEELSTVTSRGQTTVPAAVRRALGVARGGKIAYRVEGGTVTLHAATASEADQDPAIVAFLEFLANDITSRPSGLTVMSPELAARISALVDDKAGDGDDPIDGAVSL